MNKSYVRQVLSIYEHNERIGLGKLNSCVLSEIIDDKIDGSCKVCKCCICGEDIECVLTRVRSVL